MRRRVVAREAGCVFELADNRIEGAVLVVRRTEVAQPDMRFVANTLRQRLGETGFADAELGRQQHDPAVTARGLSNGAAAGQVLRRGQ